MVVELFAEDGNFAITMDGQINASCITTGFLSADRIQAGILESSEGNIAWNAKTFYREGIIINIESSRYKALVANTGVNPRLNYWSMSYDTTTALPWLETKQYYYGDIVSALKYYQNRPIKN